VEEIIDYLKPRSGEIFIDATFNEGGHSKEIFKKIEPNGKILGIEWDKSVYEKAQKEFSKDLYQSNIIVVNDSYINLAEIAKENKINNVDGILFDLGMSSWHIEESGRGFSFNREEPLDMRYSSKSKITAYDVVNGYSQENLEYIIREYGDERNSRRIAKSIILKREISPIETTKGLTEAIESVVPHKMFGKKIHVATKTFQAIRIEVNQEIENLKKGLKQSIGTLGKGGRLAVISFHSLEDRVVKNQFREWKNEGMCEIVTKKPVKPKKEEVLDNPRSRSALLRVLQKY